MYKCVWFLIVNFNKQNVYIYDLFQWVNDQFLHAKTQIFQFWYNLWLELMSIKMKHKKNTTLLEHFWNIIEKLLKEVNIDTLISYMYITAHFLAWYTSFMGHNFHLSELMWSSKILTSYELLKYILAIQTTTNEPITCNYKSDKP